MIAWESCVVNVVGRFTVTVKYMDTIKIGFSSISDASEMSADGEGMNKYRIKT